MLLTSNSNGFVNQCLSGFKQLDDHSLWIPWGEKHPGAAAWQSKQGFNRHFGISLLTADTSIANKTVGVVVNSPFMDESTKNRNCGSDSATIPMSKLPCYGRIRPRELAKPRVPILVEADPSIASATPPEVSGFA